MLAQFAGSMSRPRAQSQIGLKVTNEAQPPYVPSGPCTQVTDPNPTCTMPTKSVPKDRREHQKRLRSSAPPQSVLGSPTLPGTSVFSGPEFCVLAQHNVVCYSTSTYLEQFLKEIKSN